MIVLDDAPAVVAMVYDEEIIGGVVQWGPEFVGLSRHRDLPPLQGPPAPHQRLGLRVLMLLWAEALGDVRPRPARCADGRDDPTTTPTKEESNHGDA